MSKPNFGPRSTQIRHLLLERGFRESQLKDHRRKTRGSFWVITDAPEATHEPLFSELREKSKGRYDFRYSKNGGRATEGRRAWWWTPKSDDLALRLSELPRLADGLLNVKMMRVDLNIETCHIANVTRSDYPDGPDFTITLNCERDDDGVLVLRHIDPQTLKGLFQAIQQALVDEKLSKLGRLPTEIARFAEYLALGGFADSAKLDDILAGLQKLAQRPNDEPEMPE